jgi:hypothetical protein
LPVRLLLVRIVQGPIGPIPLDLAARMPQDIAVGLGIQLGQRYSAWPDQLYPVHYTGGELFVPRFDLGRGSVRPERD